VQPLGQALDEDVELMPEDLLALANAAGVDRFLDRDREPVLVVGRQTIPARSDWASSHEVFNTHFDHQSQPSRVKSAELLARRIADRDPKDPVIVTGDLNAGEDNPAIRYLKGEVGESPVTLVDTFRTLHADATEAGTFNGFHGLATGPRIDYIFTEPGTTVRTARILHDNRDGRYPSDHFPVTAEIVFSGAAH
jgi:endonuclease/exonuclease/phosphatase family metal-dependent hydrolase